MFQVVIVMINKTKNFFSNFSFKKYVCSRFTYEKNRNQHSENPEGNKLLYLNWTLIVKDLHTPLYLSKWDNYGRQLVKHPKCLYIFS